VRCRVKPIGTSDRRRFHGRVATTPGHEGLPPPSEPTAPRGAEPKLRITHGELRAAAPGEADSRLTEPDTPRRPRAQRHASGVERGSSARSSPATAATLSSFRLGILDAPVPRPTAPTFRDYIPIVAARGTPRHPPGLKQLLEPDREALGRARRCDRRHRARPLRGRRCSAGSARHRLTPTNSRTARPTGGGPRRRRTGPRLPGSGTGGDGGGGLVVEPARFACRGEQVGDGGCRIGAGGVGERGCGSVPSACHSPSMSTSTVPAPISSLVIPGSGRWSAASQPMSAPERVWSVVSATVGPVTGTQSWPTWIPPAARGWRNASIWW
jgi:hypothetical protein